MPTKEASRRRFIDMPYNQPIKTVEESIQFTLALLEKGDTTFGSEVLLDGQGDQTLLWHIWKDETRRTRIIMDTETSGHSLAQYWGADFYFDRDGRLIERPFDRLGDEARITPKTKVVASSQLEPTQRSMLLRSLEVKRLGILLNQHGIPHRPLAEL